MPSPESVDYYLFAWPFVRGSVLGQGRRMETLCIPNHISAWIFEQDIQVAGTANRVCEQKALPCVLYNTKPTGTMALPYMAILLGVNEEKRKSPCLVISGPDGSDVPGCLRGSDLSVGKIYESVSSVKTRMCKYSAANGWRLFCCKGKDIKTNTPVFDMIDTLRPAVGGPGFGGLVSKNLVWFYDFWDRILRERIRHPGNIALRQISSHMPSWDKVVVPEDCPFVDEKERLAYGLVIHLQNLARPVCDDMMRQRTRDHPRQKRKAARPRETRNSIGTKQNPSSAVMYYGGEFQLEKSGVIRVKFSPDKRQEKSGWAPSDVFCKRAQTVSLNRFVGDLLFAMEQQDSVFEKMAVLSFPSTSMPTTT